MITAASLLKEAKSAEDETVKIRRTVHENPELSYQENETAKLVAAELKKYGIEVTTGVGGTGVLGVLKGAKPGKVVGLRADMDGLPVEEKSDVAFRSNNVGVMHAFGHETHVAMLLWAASHLANHRDELHGTVKFFFQPAEENGGRGGAKPMIEDGVMKNPKVDFVFGLHISNRVASGEFGVKAGPAMAAPDAFKIRVIGKGGHGSAPHETIDPIYAAATLILALQGVSGRMIDPVEPMVVSVCNVHSGTKDNIIPDEALVEGTIRTLDEKTRALAKEKVASVAKGICASFGAKAEVSFMEDAYPVTFNDLKVTPRVVEVLKQIQGTRVVDMPPVLGGEDFSRFLNEAPGTFYYLGTKNPSKGCVYPNHSSMFKVDEDVLKFGVASLALLAFDFGAEK